MARDVVLGGMSTILSKQIITKREDVRRRVAGYVVLGGISTILIKKREDVEKEGGWMCGFG